MRATVPLRNVTVYDPSGRNVSACTLALAVVLSCTVPLTHVCRVMLVLVMFHGAVNFANWHSMSPVY